MEGENLGLGTGQYSMDLEEAFYSAVLDYWVQGRVPHEMVYLNHEDEFLEVYYGYA
tara:strand:+ start:50 stop:217 length:168 start_codon:yes stop_codon:yes gene_type:complete